MERRPFSKEGFRGANKRLYKSSSARRFKSHEKPLALLNAYLYQVYLEAERRGYKFNLSRIEPLILEEKTPVTRGQLMFEFVHLLNKIKERSKERFEKLKSLPLDNVEPNPIFEVVDGGIEAWEKGNLRNNRYFQLG